MKIMPKKDYLKVADLKDGDVLTIKDAGEVFENTKFTYPDGNPKKDFVFKVVVGEVQEERDFRMNKYSRDAMCESFGNDTEEWVGKQAKVVIEYVRSLKTNSVILEPITWTE